MTLRHKLADWISGGELTRLRGRVDCLLQEVSDEINETEYWAKMAERRRDALMTIRDMRAPTARHMARIAREALE